jgi:hypothetical protein
LSQPHPASRGDDFVDLGSPPFAIGICLGNPVALYRWLFPSSIWLRRCPPTGTRVPPPSPAFYAIQKSQGRSQTRLFCLLLLAFPRI